MNSKEIEALLERFYEGSTTPAEEQQLRDFFTRDEVPPHLAIHAGLFHFYEEAKEEELVDPRFENRFLEAIGETPSLPLYSRRKQFFFLSGIAAAVILLAGLVYTFRTDGLLLHKKNSADVEIAYQQAKGALALLSVNLNSGIDQAGKLGYFQKGLDDMQELKSFQKGIDQMNKLSKFYQYQQIIINPGDQTRP
jgi:hypothetical protein